MAIFPTVTSNIDASNPLVSFACGLDFDPVVEAICNELRIPVTFSKLQICNPIGNPGVLKASPDIDTFGIELLSNSLSNHTGVVARFAPKTYLFTTVSHLRGTADSPRLWVELKAAIEPYETLSWRLGDTSNPKKRFYHGTKTGIFEFLIFRYSNDRGWDFDFRWTSEE